MLPSDAYSEMIQLIQPGEKSWVPRNSKLFALAQWKHSLVIRENAEFASDDADPCRTCPYISIHNAWQQRGDTLQGRQLILLISWCDHRL